jgi:glutathione-independent formaldehyde dehydrogenase
MKAVMYKEKEVQLAEADKPVLKRPTDAIVRVTSAAICGSDLHMYENRAPMEEGKILGHEIIGVVDEVGDGVQQLKKGDRVVLPFNIFCGKCFNCVQGQSSACLALNPDSAGAGFGYAMMGPFDGGQTEYVLVPEADNMALKLPGTPHDEYEDDFLMVADIFPTAFHAAKLAAVGPGKAVAIIGAGPVGLLAVTSSKLLGAHEIYIVDHIESRLKKAEELGAIPINMADGDPVEQIIAKRKANKLLVETLRPGEEKLLEGVHCGIDAIGYQSHSQDDFSKEHHVQAIEYLAKLVLPTGHIGLIGVYLPADPGESGPAAEGTYEYPLGEIWNKGITVGGGQCPVRMYDHQLRDVIIAGGAKPGTIVTHHIPIEDAMGMYKRFDEREEGVHKVVITF